ncbi:MAG: microviridin/marinostatin family tricyclic proteinase inhibitor [Symploca sp. SIO1B1]|nr:microviridin/marinostatin family tricyclic proteinase inhibitor [Symploca sp. SIO2D2]NER92931.1 microviridin/marinostatin family tricyclic proteinase inhibitor [Symploca sp. SIO1B1]
MSNEINQQSEAQTVPFFARFLESQGSEELEGRPMTHKYPSDADEPTTYKYPSDEEDN